MPFSSFRDFVNIEPESSDFLVGYNPLRGEFKTQLITLSSVLASGGVTISNIVQTYSANWNSNYTTTSINSAQWNAGYSAYTTTLQNSALWDTGNSAYVTTNQNSGYWNTAYNFLGVGGNIGGNLNILQNLTVSGDISARGNFIVSNVTSVSALSVTSLAEGPALFVRKGGSAPGSVAVFYDGNIPVVDINRIQDGQLKINIPIANDITDTLTVLDNLFVSGGSLSATGDRHYFNGKMSIGTDDYSSSSTLFVSTSSGTLPVNGRGPAIILRTIDESAGSVASIVFSHYDDTQLARHAASIATGKEKLWTGGSGDYPGYLSFWTRLGTSGSQSEKMRITSSGNVGIGTTIPEALFTVAGGISAGGILSATGESNYFANAVGIGTPKPGELLTVAGGISALLGLSAQKINAFTDSSDVARGITSWQHGSHTGGARFEGRKARGTAATPVTINSGDTIMGLMPYGYDGSAYNQAGYIAFNAGETWGPSAHGSILTFATVSATGVNVVERMRIGSTGNVGIGTTDTGFWKLNVGDASNNSSSIYGSIRAINGTQTAWLNTNSTAGAWNPLVSVGDAALIYTKGSIETGSLVIGPHSTTSKGIRIDSSGNIVMGYAGNIGLNAFSSEVKLTVGGSVSASGDIFASNIYSERYYYASSNTTIGTAPVRTVFLPGNIFSLSANKIYELEYNIYFRPGTGDGSGMTPGPRTVYSLSADKTLANVNYIAQSSTSMSVALTGETTNQAINSVILVSQDIVDSAPFASAPQNGPLANFVGIKAIIEASANSTIVLTVSSSRANNFTTYKGSYARLKQLN